VDGHEQLGNQYENEQGVWHLKATSFEICNDFHIGVVSQSSILVTTIVGRETIGLARPSFRG
jgi:hypothetical protein